jgi:hypothetical protein
MQQETKIENLCYFAERNMKAFAANMIIFGCETFARAKHIKEIEELSSQIDIQDSFAREGKGPNQETIAIMGEFVLDTIPDWIRITICFENYMKAILLMNGFLIHKIDKNVTSLKTLANNQNKKPISLSRFQELRNFSMNIETRQWMLEGLKPQTIDFSVLLWKKYQDEIKLPEKILELISEINTKRNNLHFYHEATNAYSQIFIEELKQLNKFVKEEMMNLVSKLEIELNSTTL